MIPLIDPGDSAIFQLDWSDAVADDTTLVSVVHILPEPLVKVSESTDQVNARSTVKVSGAQHGMTYLIEAQGTLSNGESLNRQSPLRCFNG